MKKSSLSIIHTLIFAYKGRWQFFVKRSVNLKIFASGLLYLRELLGLRGLEEARLLEVLSGKSSKQITHITAGKFQPRPLIPRYNALMSIIKLTDPRYCSPLDSPNTHLSSSKGRRVFVVPVLSGTLWWRASESLPDRENRNWDTQVIPGGFPWFSKRTRARLTREAYKLRNYRCISPTTATRYLAANYRAATFVSAIRTDDKIQDKSQILYADIILT